MVSKNIDRLSSLDKSYVSGDLSIYPDAVDSKDTLYEVKNNAETVLSQSVNYSGRYLVVEDTSLFPAKGLLSVGTEIVYYEVKTGNSFQNLKRGFAGTRQNQWPVGTRVAGTVQAEPHNALKDAVVNIEKFVGTVDNPSADSLHGILKQQETRFLLPKPIFRAAPIQGPPPLSVKFQNFSTGDSVRYLWDFGDGNSSVEIAPTHVYVSEGIYTVKLSMITSSGGNGMVVKNNYVIVDEKLREGFFYVTPLLGSTSTIFSFVDQTVNALTRHWTFDDGTKETVTDPDIHTMTHRYSAAGEYNPSLIVVFEDESIRKYDLSDPIVVT